MNTQVIIDLGSHSIKGGTSEDSEPKIRLRNFAKNISGWVFGNEALGISTSDVICPVDKGCLNADHDVVLGLLNKVYSSLNIKPESSNLLLADRVLSSNKSREQLTTVAFEELNISNFLMSRSNILNMYATGQTTGISVCVGHEISSWNPFFESRSINHAVGFINVAGEKITQRLFELIQKKYPKINLNKSHYESIAEIKEKHCFFAQNFLAELQLSEDPILEVSETLSDGTQIKLGAERFLAPEVIFNPSLMGIEHLGLHDQIADAILACPMDIRTRLIENVVLDSQLTKMRGFSSRLKSSIKEDTHHFELFNSVNIVENVDGVWKGGKNFAISEMTKPLWIAKLEYDEHGPGLVHSRCF